MTLPKIFRKFVCLINSSHTLTTIQIILVSLALKSSVILVSWNTLIISTCLFFSLAWTRKQIKKAVKWFVVKKHNAVFDMNINPYKGKVGPGYLSAERETEIAVSVAESVLYDAAHTTSLKNFTKIKNQSECIFARRSKLWGSIDYDMELTLEENVRRIVPTFYKFTMAFQDLNLDAFLFELPGELYGVNIDIFGDAVRRVLWTLRKSDLNRQRQQLLKNHKNFDSDILQILLDNLNEDPKKWNKMSWVFEFNKITFFVTTFAPFYPECNSRYAFGCKDCYILFQPEIAFAIRDLPDDTAETNWDSPVTVRDKIRVAFRQAGREYEVPKKLNEPMVCEIVKKIYPDDEPIQWWLPA
ncbi:uncharacterized protein LOC131934559 [Physella acuta]|uniref:uncharacterized protein LOC131934559 n=1 Tax=Physella acuta TaxID=109671 RepID=UPI0027DDBB43|nr:uncharacterized protein LOC131934559 [Physella acuta]